MMDMRKTFEQAVEKIRANGIDVLGKWVEDLNTELERYRVEAEDAVNAYKESRAEAASRVLTKAAELRAQIDALEEEKKEAKVDYFRATAAGDAAKCKELQKAIETTQKKIDNTKDLISLVFEGDVEGTADLYSAAQAKDAEYFDALKRASELYDELYKFSQAEADKAENLHQKIFNLHFMPRSATIRDGFSSIAGEGRSVKVKPPSKEPAPPTTNGMIASFRSNA